MLHVTHLGVQNAKVGVESIAPPQCRAWDGTELFGRQDGWVACRLLGYMSMIYGLYNGRNKQMHREMCASSTALIFPGCSK